MEKIKNFFRNIVARARALSRKQWILSALALALLIGGVITLVRLGGGPEVASMGTGGRYVEVATIADLASRRSALPLTGTVTSLSEAALRAEAGGQIVGVYRKLGDVVGAGSIIAEIENSSERAAVTQAEAGLASAQAQAGISSISGESQKDLLDQSKAAAVNTIKAVYDSADDTIRTKIDPMFKDPTLSNPQFQVSVGNSQLYININAERLKITEILREQQLRKNALTPDSDLKKEIALANADLNYLKAFLEDIAAGLNQSVPTETVPPEAIGAWKVTASTARTTLTSALASISAAGNDLTSKQSAYDVSLKQSGGAGETTSSAAVKQAQAALSIAKVNLEKTLVRSPIAGTINNLSLERGNYVTPGEQVAVVSNNNALEIKAYITESDATEIAVGAKAAINGSATGVVTKVAPALDPVTKKIEVRIGLAKESASEKNAQLINGASVNIAIDRKAGTPALGQTVTIPIAALKITADGPVVFTVEGENKLISHPVKQGALLGAEVEITEGVTPDMAIVTDVRGLKNGDTVSIKDSE
jgi:RND family efflux transporter MFP subunit